MTIEIPPATATPRRRRLVDLEVLATSPSGFGRVALPLSNPVMTAVRMPLTRFEIGMIAATPSPPSRAISTAPALSLQIESGDGYLTVYDEYTGIFGAGATLVDAFSDLAAALVEHRDVLERQDQLSSELERQLQYLRQRVPR